MEDNAALLLRASAIGALVCFGYFGLRAAFEYAIADSPGTAVPYGGLFDVVLSIAVVAVFIGLLVLQHLFMRIAPPLRQAIQVHLYNGLYVDVLVTRLITRLWSLRPAPIVS